MSRYEDLQAQGVAAAHPCGSRRPTSAHSALSDPVAPANPLPLSPPTRAPIPHLTIQKLAVTPDCSGSHLYAHCPTFPAFPRYRSTPHLQFRKVTVIPVCESATAFMKTAPPVGP